MPRKKKNWELEYGNIHNNPEQFYYKFGDITLLSENLFQTPKIIRLEQNYRSTQNILECASVLIDKNKNRYGKKLWSDNEIGEKISINGFWETK